MLVRIVYTVCAAVLALASSATCLDQSKPSQTPFNIQIQHSAESGDLLKMLAFSAATFHIPMVMELVQPFPAGLSLSAGKNSASQVLDALISACPGYAWQEDHGVAVVYNVRLKQSPGNFLNNRVPVYVMPNNAGDLKLELKSVLESRGRNAGVIVGIKEPELTALKISGAGKVLENLTGREILVEAAKESPDLFSVIVFPTSNPRTKQDKEEAHLNWYLRSIRSLTANPIPIRTTLSTKQK